MTANTGVSVGLVLPTRNHPAPVGLSTVLRIGEFADAAPGWSTLWTPDSILALPYYDSGVLLAALAARTRRVRLGTACFASLGFRHPVAVARQWADLDALSGGRMTMVACPGNGTGRAVERELRVFGLTYPEKVARFEEAVRFLRAASSSPTTSFAGKYVQIDDLQLAPGFVQRPLPIWIAANPSATAGPKTLDRVLGRVARLGDGWMTFNVTPEQLATRVGQLREFREAAGHSNSPGGNGEDDRTREGTAPFPVCVYLNANVSANAAQARADAAARWAQQSTRNVSATDLERIGAIGSPEEAADFIGRLVEAGATHLAIDLLSTDPERQVEQLTDLLLPRLGTPS